MKKRFLAGIMAVMLIVVLTGCTNNLFSPDWNQPEHSSAPGEENYGDYEGPSAESNKPSTQNSNSSNSSPQNSTQQSTSQSSTNTSTPTVEKDGLLTYEEYQALDANRQMAYYNSFETPQDYMKWFNDAYAEYQKQQSENEIDGEDGINIGDLLDKQ